MADDLRFDIEFQFRTLATLKDELKKAKIELDKLSLGTDEFAKKEKQVFLLNQRIKELTTLTKAQITEQQRLAEAQEKETAALQRYLGKAEERTRKEIEAETKIFQVRAQNVKQMERLSQLQMQSGSSKLVLGTGTMTDQLNQTASASANASMALMNLNYVVRDSPYFFNNFALGILAVGNNLNPLIDSFNRLRTEAVGKNISTFALLKQALVGGAGISIAFSVVVTAIQSFVFWQSRAKAETDKAKESIVDYTEKLQDLSNEYTKAQQLNFESLKQKYGVRESELQGYITQLEGESKAGKKMSFAGLGAGEPMQRIPDLLKKYRDELESLQKTIKAGDPSYQSYISRLTEITVAANTGVGAIKRLNVPLADLRQALSNFAKSYDAALPTDRAAWKKRYDNLKEAIKQLDLLDDKIKKVKITGEEAGILEATSKQVNFLGGAGESNRIFRQPTYLRGNRVEASDLRNPSERTSAQQIGKGMKDLSMDLEMGKIVANQLGDALASAFEKGKIKLNELLQSLTLAIAKMVLLKAVTSLLTGGFGGGASALKPVASVGDVISNTGSMWNWGDATRFNKSSYNPTFVFENTIEGQKIVLKGVKERNAILR